MSSHTPHELYEFFGHRGFERATATTLAEEFPHDAKLLTRLKLTDKHFCGLAQRYHALNRSIHRIEAEVENTSNAYLERLKKQRLMLLDTIALIIEKAEASLDPSETGKRAFIGRV